MTSNKLKSFLDTAKHESRILGDVQRFLMGEFEKGSDRDQTMIHPSEMAKKNWCHRATYYRIKGDHPHIPADPRDFSFGLENVFEEGHEIHNKWQTRLWDMGVLGGMFRCRVCRTMWEDVAPQYCKNKDCVFRGSRELIHYVEVPVFHDEYLILGHSDGEIVDGKGKALLEVKSIGVGTLRFEQPELLGKYTRKVTEEDGTPHTYIDYEALFKGIRRPMPSHLRQGMIYCFCTGINEIVFIYEWKFNQQVKEFTVKLDMKVIEPLLDACLDIKFALKRGIPPPCPNGGDKGCADCLRYETENEDGEKKSRSKDTEPDARGRKVVARRQGKAREASPVPARAARRASSGNSARPRRVVRRRSDGSAE